MINDETTPLCSHSKMIVPQEVSKEAIIDLEETKKVNGDGAVPSINYFRAAWDISRFSLPFMISRGVVAVNVICNGSVTPKIGPNATAAGPLMISVVYAIIGPGRSILLSTGILTGRRNGEVLAYIKSGNQEQAKITQEAIGKQIRQSIFLGTMLAIPSMAIMVSVGPLLKLTGLNLAIASEVEGFLNATAIGVTPMYWSTTDQQFAMGTGHKYIPMVFGSLFPVLSMAFGYPLALGAFGLPELGTAGLGYGMSAAAWISFLALRLYLLKSEFSPFRLYKPELRGLSNQFSELLKLGLPMGFQALSEWGNLFLLSSLVSRNGGNALMAANGSFQIMTAFTLVSAALGQGISVQIAGQLGKMKVAEQLSHAIDLKTLSKNIKRLGNAGIMTGVVATAALATLFISIPKPIQSLFISKEDANYEEVMAMAQAMLIINAVGLIFDNGRNMAASALSGSKDVLFAPLFSLLTMSIMALGSGALITDYFDLDVNWLFITRDIGILAAAFGIAIKWVLKNHLPVMKPTVEEPSVLEATILTINAPEIEKKKTRTCCFFKAERFENWMSDGEQYRYPAVSK